MKPAIAATSWKMMLTHGHRVLVGPSQVPQRVTDLPSVPRHALAALALYGQPFGFTREDVGTLRQAGLIAKAQGAVADSRALSSLADRIEALLPPEG